MKSLGERLAYARKLRGLSQAELARAVGISQGAIGNVESRPNATLRNLVEVARALRVSVDWLYDGKGPAPDANGAGAYPIGVVRSLPVREPAPNGDYAGCPLRIDRRKLHALSPEDLLRLEGALLHAASSLGLDIKRQAAS